MRWSQIIGIANADGIALPDLDLMVVLGQNVLPAFIMDCGSGYTNWRRTRLTIDVLIDTATYTLPQYVSTVQDIFPVLDTAGSLGDKLRYLGEISEGLVGTFVTPALKGLPDCYTLSQNVPSTGTATLATASGGLVVWFNKTHDRNRTYRVAADIGLPTSDFNSDHDMNTWVPPEYQWGLVEGLKMELYKTRFGAGDKRYALAERERDKWVMRASVNTEQNYVGKAPRFAR